MSLGTSKIRSYSFLHQRTENSLLKSFTKTRHFRKTGTLPLHNSRQAFAVPEVQGEL